MDIEYYSTRAALTDAAKRRNVATRKLHHVRSTGVAYQVVQAGGGFVERGYDERHVIQGSRLFQLKATHGIPLDTCLQVIHGLRTSSDRIVVNWTSFITEARKNGWYDFQTIEVIENALLDAAPMTAPQLMLRLKRWILSNPMD